MRSYEDISKRIMERGDKLIEERKVRAARIKHTSYAVSGMCAAAIAGIGVWHIAANVKKPDDGFKGSGIVSATEAATESTVTAEVTKAAVTTSEKPTVVKTTAVTTDIKTTDTSAAVTLKTTAAASTAPLQTASVKTTTIYVTASESPVTETTTIPSVTETPETTAADTPLPVTTTNIGEEGFGGDGGGNSSTEESAHVDPTGPSGGEKTTTAKETASDITTTTVQESPLMGNGGYTPVVTTSLQDVFRENPSYITINGVHYEKDSMVPEQSVGDYFRRVDLHIMRGRQDIKAVMIAYTIDGIDTEEAVAVRLNDTEEYYLFRNASYRKVEE